MEIEKDKVYTFKLTSGQEVIAKVADIDNDYYHVSAALTLGQGPNGVGFMPAISSGEPIVDTPLLKMAVAMITPTREDIREAYVESVDPSGIIKPEPKQIITG